MFNKLFGKKNQSKNELKSDKFVALDENQSKHLLGGGDPVPGLDVNLEQHPPAIRVGSTTSSGGIH